MQEVTKDLPKAAKIISDQKPHSLKWASERFNEFGRILAVDYELAPDRLANGFDSARWSSSADDELVFFDQYYGVPKDDPYHRTPAYLRLSLQLSEKGKRNPESRVHLSLYLDFFENKESEDKEQMLCTGKIELIGAYGKAWQLDGHLTCQNEHIYNELSKHVPDIFPSHYYKEACEKNRDSFVQFSFGADPNPKYVRDLFKDMVGFYLSKREQP